MPMGTVSQTVVREAPCPVLIVHPTKQPCLIGMTTGFLRFLLRLPVKISPTQTRLQQMNCGARGERPGAVFDGVARSRLAIIDQLPVGASSLNEIHARPRPHFLQRGSQDPPRVSACMTWST